MLLKRRLPVVSSVTILILLLLAQLVTAAAASAAAPSIHGWWSQTSLGVGPTLPPDVPPEGMFVQNLPTGPTALSALQFALPSDAVVDKLTLRISGTPVISQAPVACSATSTFKPAEGGPWSDRPSYDCAHPVPGVVNADNTRIEFVVAGLTTAGGLSVVVLAGGPTDRIAFVKPGDDALTVKTFGTLPSLPPAPAQPATLGPIPFPQSTDGTPLLPTPGPIVAPQPKVIGAAPSNVGQQDSARRRVGTTLGVILLLLSILYWSDGFGALPLRSSLVARVRRVRSGTVGV